MLASPPLNHGQQTTADAFFEFLFRDEERELILSGPGGVGKTHLMSYLIDEIMPRYEATCRMMGIPPKYTRVEMTATTNKAAEVLAVATKRPTSTIHSFLALTVKDDYLTGDSKLSSNPNTWRVHENLILFIDECSMIDKPLLDFIRAGTHNSKIIYVGDHCQLAPIKEPISPIYRDNLPFFELTQPMRTSNPHLLALNQQLRNTVETGEFLPIQLVHGSIDWMTDQDLQEGMELIFKDQEHASRILAYTNDRVIAFNDHIRTLRNLPDEYMPGELLISNSAIKLKLRQISVEEELRITYAEPEIVDMEIEPEVILQVRPMVLESSIGDIFNDVPVPVDKAHFLALIKYYAKKKNWNRYFYLKNTFPDLRQRDAATFHKAQGSSYDYVFIDLGNLSTCHNPNQAARMLYVAASRARERVFFYGNLAAKYGGLIDYI